MLRKILFILVAAAWLQATSAYAASPKNIKIFTTLAKADEIIDLQKSDLPDTTIDVYFVDRKQDILKSMNSHIPIEKFKQWDEDERYQWAKDYVRKMAPKKTLRIMKSTLGVSYMRLFEINRVPAVLMDNYYLTYGLTLSESVRKYDLLQGK